MWNVVQFPRTRIRGRSSGVRVAYVADRWCVERLEAGDIISRSRMPARSDAERIATRISRRDKIALLAPCIGRSPYREQHREWHRWSDADRSNGARLSATNC